MTFLESDRDESHQPVPINLNRRTGSMLLLMFGVLLIALPVAVRMHPSTWLALIDSFYRTGALVFGGGHVVLPLLHEEVITHGWMTDDVFVAGYSAAQALPGPLFTFSAFLGASIRAGIDPLIGGLLCLLAIFAPSLLLVLGSAPHWSRVRDSQASRSIFAGINASVVGLLLAALYRPIISTAVHGPVDLIPVAIAWVALVYGRVPPWIVVIGGGLAGVLVRRW